MKRYIFVSDIHGCYTKLIDALNKIHFDQENDILVSVGDAFDRGSENIQVLKFLVNLPNKILLWGNHDLRLYNLITKRKSLSWIDEPNGTIGSIRDFGEDINVFDSLEKLYEQKTELSKLLFKYFDSCYFALEFSDLYATHGWLPYSYFENKKLSNISRDEWEDSTWSNTESKVYTRALVDKTLLVGHFHAFRIAEKCFNEKRYMDDFQKVITDICISPDNRLICIDGCTNISRGKVNTYIYETDETPKLYREK